MDSFLERKISVNAWVLKARWFYIFGIFFSGVLVNVVGPYYFPLSIVIRLAILAFLVNIVSLLVFKIIKYTESNILLFSIWQILYEMMMFATIFYYAGGLESATTIFFILPIIISAIIIGPNGAIVSSVISGMIIAGIVFLEYQDIFPHFYRFGVMSREYIHPNIAMTNIIVYFFFYLVVGFYSGYFAKLLFSRELELQDQKETLFWQRRKTEEEKKKTSAVLNNLIDPIVVIDKNDKISFINPAAARAFGFNEDDIGVKISKKNNYSVKNLSKLIEYDHVFEDQRSNKILKEGEEGIKVTVHGNDSDYKVVTANIIDERKEHLGTLKAFHDITREKTLNQLKSEFISVAAHQLRTPLSAIKWAIRMVLDGEAGELNNEQSQLLKKGYVSNERIISLVNDMLNVSRIEEGRFDYSFTKVNVVEIIEERVSRSKDMIDDKEIKVEISSPKNLPKISVDKDKFTLVISNILDNAIRYTPHNGTIKIILKTSKGNLLIDIEDNGIGIPVIDQNRMFEKFFRAQNAVRLQTEGSGLGLFIARNIIKSHGGSLELDSEEGKGTRVFISVPIKK